MENHSENTGQLEVTVQGVTNGQLIPPEYAFAMNGHNGQLSNGGNTSPAISWENVPMATQSFVVIVVDRDAPQNSERADKEGEIIEEEEPRQNFYHWVVINLPPNINHLQQG